MPNIKISDLPPIAGGFDPAAVFLEVQDTVAGEPVSRKITPAEITSGASPLGATYVTVTANAILPNERILTGTVNVLSVADGGAGGNITLDIEAAGIDNARLADMDENRVKGRADGTGTGVPIDLTPAQLNGVLASGGFATYFSLTATDRVVGSNAGSSQTGDNVFLANALAGDVNIADKVIAIGVNALAAAATLDFEGSIVIGANAGSLIDDTRDPWIIIGNDACRDMPGAGFHDGNTIIGHRALIQSQVVNLQATTILGFGAGSRIDGVAAAGGNVFIGFEAVGGGTETSSVTNSVIIGDRAVNSYGPLQIGNLVVIGRFAAQDLSGDDDLVAIGANCLGSASGSDRSVFIGASCYGNVTGSTDSVYIGSGAGGADALGNFNVIIGAQSLTTPGAGGLDHSVMLGFSVGNDIGSETNLFLVESTQGTTSFVNRPYIYGSTLNGNLALLSVFDTSTQDENGTRNIPTWGSANGVWTMSGAGADLGATGDADFMHSWIRNADTALMLQFPSDDTISLLHNGTDSIIANSAGAMRLNGTGSIILSSNSIEGLQLAEDNSGVLQVPSAAVTITAFAGGGQGSAVALIHSYNVITVVATAGDSVRLPDVFSVNSLVYIKNDGVEAADVFPAVGDDLGAGVNTAVSLPTGESATFIATAGNSTWTELIVAPGSAPITIATSLLATNPAGPAIVDEAATSTNPTLIPNQAELDTGFGWSVADNIAVILGGVRTVSLGVGGVNSNTSDSWNLLHEASSQTNPTLIPSQGDSSTGIGGAPNGVSITDLSLIARGVEIVRVRGHNATPVLRGITIGPGATLFGSATDPSLAFHDGNSGLFQPATDVLAVSVGTIEAMRWTELNSGVVQAPAADVAITAFSGGGQGSATPLTQSYNVVTVVAGFNDSVRLPDVFAVNSVICVKNASTGVNKLQVFPASGDDLGEGVNTARDLLPGVSLWFIATTANSTWTELTAGGAPTELIGNFNNGPRILDIQPNTTTPTIVPTKSDLDTGLGHGGNDIFVAVAGGVQALQLRELSGGVFQAPSATLGITAFAGGGQGSATVLIDSYNTITVVATAGDSVRLPTIFSVNTLMYIKNDDATEAADIFPASGDNLGAGVDTAVSLPAGQSISFMATIASSTWTQLDAEVVSSLFNNGVEVGRTVTIANGGLEVSSGNGFHPVVTETNFVVRRQDGDVGAVNDITPNVVTDLAHGITVAAGEHCIIEGMLRFESVSATPGVRWQVDVSGASLTDSSVAWTLMTDAGASPEGDVVAADVDITHGMASASEHVYNFRATVAANATLLCNIAFAQDVSDGTQTRLLDGSWVKYSIVQP